MKIFVIAAVGVLISFTAIKSHSKIDMQIKQHACQGSAIGDDYVVVSLSACGSCCGAPNGTMAYQWDLSYVKNAGQSDMCPGTPMPAGWKKISECPSGKCVVPGQMSTIWTIQRGNKQELNKFLSSCC